MGEIIINGGNRLSGEICIQGSKNAVLPILAATILTGDECVIHNCPRITDAEAAFDILRALGCRACCKDNTAVVCAADVDKTQISRTHMQRMRSSVTFLGAVLARCGEVTLCRPGGCKIGERPIDMHINSLKKLGAEIDESGDFIYGKLTKVNSGELVLLYPSVGVTENIMLLCAGKNCDVKICNAAKDPEIVQLANVLNIMGADIRGAGSDEIRICPAYGLKGFEYSVASDRIVSATYMCMTAACGGDVFMRDAVAEHNRLSLAVMEDAGCKITAYNTGIRIKADRPLRGRHRFKTLPYPGFPTDVQPMLCAAFAQSDGRLEIDETVFEKRFSYAPDLIRMGADISQCRCLLEVRGVPRLHGGEVTAYDLRGGAALVTAGLAAEGTTIISGVEYIKRGYDSLDVRLKALGADICMT